MSWGRFRSKKKKDSKGMEPPMVIPKDPTPLPERIKKIWAKDANKLPTSKDLPRLVQHIRIIDEKGDRIEGKGLWNGKKHLDKPTVTSMRNVVLTVNEMLSGNSSTHDLAKSWDEAEWREDYSSPVLEDWMDDIGEDQAVIRLLKCVNQTIVGPCVYEIKSLLPPYTDRQTKDVKDGWKIYIRFYKNSIRIIHTKKETAVEADPKLKFDVHWELAMQFDRSMREMISADFHVVHMRFGEEVPNSRRDELRGLLAPLRPHTPEESPQNVAPSRSSGGKKRGSGAKRGSRGKSSKKSSSSSSGSGSGNLMVYTSNLDLMNSTIHRDSL